MGREEMRAGDGDREQVVTKLKAALDEGRLDLHEYDERLQKAYSAKTYGELDGLLTDLPGTVPTQQSQVVPHAAASPVAPPPAAEPEQRGGMPNWAGPYGGLIAVCILIWGISSVASGHLLYFWPVWMLIPLILGIAGQMGGGRGRGRDRRRDRRRDR